MTDLVKTYLATYQYRIKGDSSKRRLIEKAPCINFVWNYCNETSYHAIRNYSKWLSEYDLNNLTKGSSKELKISSETINAICEHYVKSRVNYKKIKLKWRISAGSKKSLGWIPFKARSIKLLHDHVIYRKEKYRIWNSRDLPENAVIKSGSFSEDSEGHWYVNITCEIPVQKPDPKIEDVGIDLSLKDEIVFSNDSPSIHFDDDKKLLEKLARAKHFGKRRLAKSIHAKILNKRKDFFHKQSEKIAKNNYTIFAGQSKDLDFKKPKARKVEDASVRAIKPFLKYKAIRHSGVFLDASSLASTTICSHCLKETGPSGLNNRCVREWVCSNCNTVNDRAKNSSINILRVGRDSLRSTLID